MKRTIALAVVLAAHLGGARAAVAAPAPKPAREAKDEGLAEQIARLRAESKLDEALPLAERLLARTEAAHGPDHPDVAQALLILADVRRMKGEFKLADPMLRRALAIREKALGPEALPVAQVLQILGDNLRLMGKEADAEPLLVRSIAIREKALGPDHIDVARSVFGLGKLYTTLRQPERAIPLLERALAIREKALGPDHKDVAATLEALAVADGFMGEYVRAESLLRRVLAIREKALGPDHPEVAQVLSNLSPLLERRNEYGEAEKVLSRALSIIEKTLGPDHPDAATTLGNLAALHLAEEDYAAAEPLAARAVAILEKTLGPDHPTTASNTATLAEIAWMTGDEARAERLYLRALAVVEKALGPDDMMIADDLLGLGRIADARGDHARAGALFARASAVADKAHGPQDLDAALVLDAVAEHHEAAGDIPGAVRARDRASAVRDDVAAVMLGLGDEAQKRAYMKGLEDETHAIVSLHARSAPGDRDAARLALRTVLRRKGRVLDVMAGSFAAIRAGASPEDRARLDRLAVVCARIAALSRGDPDEAQRAALAKLEAERSAIEADLSARSAAFRAEQPVTIEQIAAAIPEGAALLEIVRYRPLHAGARPGAQWGAPRYVAYVLRHGGEVAATDLGDAAPIDAAVERLRAALADHDRTHDPRPAARALDALVTAPARRLIGPSGRVLVSPDGALNLVPFGALVDEEGRFLVERYAFTYLTTGREILRFGAPAAPRRAALVVGDPAFGDFRGGADDGLRGLRSVDLRDVEFTPLPGTRAEALAVGASLGGAEVLLGADATETAIKAAHGPRVLHVATHGFFLAAAAGPTRLESTLLRSGIALAGANARASGADDGILTALEAAALDLSGTKLVVLSACETAQGTAVSGDGVYGMRRALVMAGAETQVLSLWKVDSGRTRELMRGYYARLAAGEGRGDALRDVQLAMLDHDETSHPSLWAAFIVSGNDAALDGRAPPPRVAPGPRGCACQEGRGASGGRAGGLAGALLVASAVRRRRGAGGSTTGSSRSRSRTRG
jgi:CHAT domain-containing protein